VSAYIITTRHPGMVVAPRPTCRAAATLDEARGAIFVAITDATMENEFDLDSLISEAGGTVGPLLDGAVIEVTPTDAADLIARMVERGDDYGDIPEGPLSEIVDAYNDNPEATS
jgi:hypothetical protein